MGRSRDHIEVQYGFIDHTLAELDDTTLRVWLILRRHYNPFTERSEPTEAVIAGKANKSIRSVQRSIKLLEEKGFLTAERIVLPGETTGKFRNSYILHYGKSRDEKPGRT